ncbi:outer membrane protein assembly factor BamC [Candidatus Doolittlea endobia]|uniref:outer membrane protein assembly factor BamC n=1 Tax=Candidatus Doolittlea endobia TaxID=1778262 RepID=UPI00083635D6
MTRLFRYKLQVTKVVLIIILLEACTSVQDHKCHIKGSQDYLKAPLLCALRSPSGIILPLHNDNYEIPAIPYNGAVGKELNICPPALLNDSRSQYSTDKTCINTDKTHDPIDTDKQ